MNSDEGKKVQRVNINKSVVNDDDDDNKSVDTLSAENLFTTTTNFSFIDPKQCFSRRTLDAMGHLASITSHFFAPSKGTKPGTPFCLADSSETGSNSE